MYAQHETFNAICEKSVLLSIQAAELINNRSNESVAGRNACLSAKK